MDLTKRAMCAEEVGFPLLILTGAGSDQLAVYALKSGAMDYLVKNPDELRELPWRVERANRRARGRSACREVTNVSTQRFWLKELLITLIENGLASKGVERPRVEITCEERGQVYQFKVKENSTGLDAKDLDRIFASSEELRPYDYTGPNVRLSICKKILDKFGSKISVESGPGEITTFCFSLPKE